MVKAYRKIIGCISFFFKRLIPSARRLPDFLVIGVQKGGTRFLYHCLDQHPDIIMPNSKEVHFFDTNFKKGIRWYKAFFPMKIFSKEKMVGEITPRYIFWKEVPQRCKAMLPNAKIIVLLRNPTERAYSHYNMTKRKHGVEISFEEYIQKAIDGDSIKIMKGNKPETKRLKALERGLYHDQIKRWLRYYPRENFLFLESEQFFQTPGVVLEQVHEFLGLPNLIPDDLTPQHVGGYKVEISSEARNRLDDFFKESNQWLLKEGFDFGWLHELGL